MKNKKRYEIDEFTFKYNKFKRCIYPVKLKDKDERIKVIKDNKGKITKVIDPELVVADYKKNFFHDYKLNRKGKVTWDKEINPESKDKEDEFESAYWLADNFGWNVHIVKEDDHQDSKSFVDLYTNKQWWEVKSTSSINSIDKQTQKACHQLTEKNAKSRGGAIINVRDNNSDKINGLTNKQIIECVENRINRTCRVDGIFIIRRMGTLISVLRIRHK